MLTQLPLLPYTLMGSASTVSAVVGTIVRATRIDKCVYVLCSLNGNDSHVIAAVFSPKDPAPLKYAHCCAEA
jgi:hypothetical protein